MARHDKQMQANMDFQSYSHFQWKNENSEIETFDNVPREVLLDIIRNQLDDARESLCPPKQKS